MSHIIIDRRQNERGKSTPNRQRYVRRVREQVREAVRDVIRDGSIKDIVDGKGKKIRIPAKGLKQPRFRHDDGGIVDHVLPGNKKFSSGDRVDRPEDGGGGKGKNASQDGDGEDDFEFHLTQEEFFDIFFEDLELHNLTKKEITKIDEWAYRRAGFSIDGNPARLNVKRSMKQSKKRRLALRTPKRKKLRDLEAELESLESLDTLDDQQKDRVKQLEDEIKALKRKIRSIPFIDDVDLRYNRWERVPIPSTQAVMFCLMDVSASMGSWEKEMAKRVFMLLYLFLRRNYERVDIRFIRHTHIAKEVDEDEFFYSKESGGTLVSSSLELMDEIVKKEYPLDRWNIFGLQASDGDNWPDDSIVSQELMSTRILPMSQYYAYVELDKRGGRDSDLWSYYEHLKAAHSNFDMAVVSSAADIYPVFRGLFEKRD